MMIKRTMLGIVSVLATAVAVGLPSAAQSQYYGDDNGDTNLTLICWGEGRKPGTQYRNGYEWNPRRDRYEYRGRIESGTQEFDSEVQLEFHDGLGRIHLTGRMIPPIHSGGRRGWWDLTNVRFTSDRITARYRLNGANKPKVEINRRTGRIKIDGIEKFRGECDAGEWGDVRNRF
ncbi:hypothetical protein DXH95_10730 [Sphingorhabdus pulchriflava]|uniref:Secreted protein n=1 Tax=Sphingorhabdus pulchriflava TaxID=2292257 RepID=A0A371B4D0_9SPHN|nr:hypothetical protein [Sphingorhabdus pulchriflava]RDV02448.1 hypothetical protein DXH95_10730 [Sphingorhabdus pulchriflava]